MLLLGVWVQLLSGRLDAPGTRQDVRIVGHGDSRVGRAWSAGRPPLFCGPAASITPGRVSCQSHQGCDLGADDGKGNVRCSRHRTTPTVAGITSQPHQGIGQPARDYAAAFSS
jgi:hypothetical protein